MDSLPRGLRGHVRHPAVIGFAVVACALCAPVAAAQLPEVTSPVPVPKQVQETLNQPLPEPAESIVEDTPAGDVRDTVRGVAGGSQGGAGGNGGGSSGSAGSTPTAPSGDQSAVSPQGGGSAPSSGGGDGGSQRQGSGSTQTPSGGDTPVASEPARGDDRAGSQPPGDATEAQQVAEERGPVGGAFRDIVEVVPGWLWVVLGLLGALVLALTARTAVERRSRHRLEREREQLLGDLGLLQSALLPEVPEKLGALAASVAYRPADGPAAGGDFYDAFELTDGRVAAILGDVSGHGREALVRTASVRHSLRTFLRSGLEPRAALAASGELMTDTAEGEFVTVVAAVHDPVAGTLTYATAGHPPPIVRGPGAHEPVTVASSPPLGLGLPTGMRQTTVALPWGGVTCLFTDGLLEARSGDDLFGRERVEELVAELGPGEGARQLLGRILDEADEASDDMAACVLRAVDGARTDHPRIEVLEIGGAAVDREVAGDLMTTCGVSKGAAAEAVDVAAGIVAESGAAVIAVTVGAGEPSVEVTGPAQSPLALAGD